MLLAHCGALDEDAVREGVVGALGASPRVAAGTPIMGTTMGRGGRAHRCGERLDAQAGERRGAPLPVRPSDLRGYCLWLFERVFDVLAGLLEVSLALVGLTFGSQARIVSCFSGALFGFTGQLVASVLDLVI